jgi:ABC-type branched-subunit amino acid transport system substrate-binding protein
MSRLTADQISTVGDMSMRRPTATVLLLCLALASACGGRVDQAQVRAEAAEDGVALAAGAAGRTGDSAAAGDGSEGAVTGETVAGGDAGVGGAGADQGAQGDGGGTDGASTAPQGGNGGATDVGVTEDRILLGNVSTLSGPVPGLFRGALVGAQAWAAMVNSQGGIDGRMIEVRSADDGLDSGRNKNGHLALKNKVFGFLGSFSVTDDGGVSELAGTNIPDVGVPLAPSRFKLPTNFAAVPVPPGWETGPAQYYIKTFGPAPVKKTALFVSAVETARIAARRERAVLESLGYEIVYTREVQPNEPNYTGDVIQMRSQGVQTVMWEGQADQIADLVVAMDDQNFKPTILNPGSTAYSHAFLKQAGAAAEGARIDLTHALFLDGDAHLPEVKLFREWMAKVDPNQDVDLFALFAWTSGRLLEKALRDAGPAITRDTVLAALGTVTTFDANGIIAPSNPAGKRATDCFVVIRVEDGKFVREHPSSGFDCQTGGFKPVPE